MSCPDVKRNESSERTVTNASQGILYPFDRVHPRRQIGSPTPLIENVAWFIFPQNRKTAKR